MFEAVIDAIQKPIHIVSLTLECYLWDSLCEITIVIVRDQHKEHNKYERLLEEVFLKLQKNSFGSVGYSDIVIKRT